MRAVKLSTICDIQAGGTPSRSQPSFWENGIIPWVKISDIESKYINTTSEFITHEGLAGSSAKLFPKGTIVYTIFATLGEVAILNVDAATNQAIAALVLKDTRFSVNYLYYYLKSLKPHVNGIGRGVAQNNINLSILRDFEIPCKAIEEQQQISRTLETAEHVIELLRLQLNKLDELVKARFVEMFGEIKGNQKNWVTETVDSVTRNIIAGSSVNGESRKLKTGESAVLKVSAVTSGYFKSEEYKVITENTTLSKRLSPRKGDILFSRANTRELVGATAIADADYPNLFLPDKIWKIETNEKINSVYFKTYLSNTYIRNLISSSASGTSGSMYNVSMKKLRAIPVLLPDIGMQNAFAAFVEEVDKSKVIGLNICTLLELIQPKHLDFFR